MRERKTWAAEIRMADYGIRRRTTKEVEVEVLSMNYDVLPTSRTTTLRFSSGYGDSITKTKW